jgi:hypothetical protein
MGRDIETDELEMAMEQDEVQDAQAFEAMVSRMNETGFEERSLRELEESQVGADLFRALTWQEQQPLEQRLGNVRGMLQYLRSRPGRFHRTERELIQVLEGLVRWGEALLGSCDAESVPEEINWAVERSLFEDTLYAATEEFFELVEKLDEPWPV